MNTTNTIGYIYHVVNSTTLYGPILTITGMSDFAFQTNMRGVVISARLLHIQLEV